MFELGQDGNYLNSYVHNPYCVSNHELVKMISTFKGAQLTSRIASSRKQTSFQVRILSFLNES